MKTYDRVLSILKINQAARNSDKVLIWQFWMEEGKSNIFDMSREKFMEATSPESIRRARQKAQELNPDVRATSERVKTIRRQKQETKGTFIFREDPEQGKLL